MRLNKKNAVFAVILIIVIAGLYLNPSRTPVRYFIGGYDPVLMATETTVLMRKKKLISKRDAVQIKKITDSYKSEIFLGGIDLLKLNELMINKLLSTQNITKDQAEYIIETSRNAGGVLIGQYNVVILGINILESLYANGKITLEEGQQVIDKAEKGGTAQSVL